MFGLGTFLVRQTRALASIARIGLRPMLLSTSSEASSSLDGRLSRHHNLRTRPLCTTNGENRDDDDSPFSLVRDDIQRANVVLESMLRKHIKNEEMYNIVNHYFDGHEGDLSTTCLVSLLFTQAMNVHFYDSTRLTDDQLKMVALVNLYGAILLYVDDMADDSATRRGQPSAHRVWGPCKVIAANKMAIAILLSEGSTLKNNAYECILYTFLSWTKSCLHPFREDYLEGDVRYKSFQVMHDTAAMISSLVQGLSRVTHTRHALEMDMSTMCYSVGLLCSLGDCVKDMREDLEGEIFKFPLFHTTDKGSAIVERLNAGVKTSQDVEDVLNLFDKAGGYEEIKDLAEFHYSNIMRGCRLLKDSPYKQAIIKCVDVSYLLCGGNAVENDTFNLMIKMMVIVVVVFTMCWLPYNVLMVSLDITDLGYWQGIPYLWFTFHWLAMSHTCYNPIIYCWMNARFRAGFCAVLSHIPCVRRLLPINAHHRRGASSSMAMNMTNTGAETSETTSLHRVNTNTTYVSVRHHFAPSRPTSVKLSTVRMPHRDGFNEDRI